LPVFVGLHSCGTVPFIHFYSQNLTIICVILKQTFAVNLLFESFESLRTSFAIQEPPIFVSGFCRLAGS